MNELQDLIDNNERWADPIKQEDPDFFAHKVGAGITVGGTRNGGQEATMNSITNFFLTQGMTVCTG